MVHPPDGALDFPDIVVGDTLQFTICLDYVLRMSVVLI